MAYHTFCPHPSQGMLHCAMYRATCLATPLWDKLHEPLQKVESSSTFCNDFTGVAQCNTHFCNLSRILPLGDHLHMRGEKVNRYKLSRSTLCVAKCNTQFSGNCNAAASVVVRQVARNIALCNSALNQLMRCLHEYGFLARKPFFRFFFFFPIHSVLYSSLEWQEKIISWWTARWSFSKSIFAALKIILAACQFFILLTFHFRTQQRYILYKDRTKNHLRYEKQANNTCRAKIYAFVLPPEIANVGPRRLWRQKLYLPGEEQEESLMKKLIRIEWVMAIRPTPKPHGMTTSSMS